MTKYTIIVDAAEQGEKATLLKVYFDTQRGTISAEYAQSTGDQEEFIDSLFSMLYLILDEAQRIIKEDIKKSQL